MQVLILDDDPEYQARLARALAARDFQIVCVDSLAAAEAVVRMGLPDLLILGERVHGRLSHSVALLADCREPGIPSVFITDRQGEEIAELFELIPAVYSIMGRATAPAMVAQIAVAAVAAMAPRDAWAALPADAEVPAPVVVPVTVLDPAAPATQPAAGIGLAFAPVSVPAAVADTDPGILADRIADPGAPQTRAALAASLARLPPLTGRRLHLG